MFCCALNTSEQYLGLAQFSYTKARKTFRNSRMQKRLPEVFGRHDISLLIQVQPVVNHSSKSSKRFSVYLLPSIDVCTVNLSVQDK